MKYTAKILKNPLGKREASMQNLILISKYIRIPKFDIPNLKVSKTYKLFITLLTLTLSTSSTQASQIRIGIGKSPEKNQKSVSVNVEYAGNALSFSNNIYPLIGINRNVGGCISSVHGCLMLKTTLQYNLFLEIAFGGAIHNGPLKTQKSGKYKRTLGSRVLFREAANLGYIFGNKHSSSLYIDHISNASLRKPNSGVTNIGIKYAIPL